MTDHHRFPYERLTSIPEEDKARRDAWETLADDAQRIDG